MLHLADRRYAEISGGERQLALIARALTQEPKLLVMDEPTANLDFGNQLLVLDRVEALARQGMAIILSTHDPDQAFRCCDKVVLLHRGRMLAQASPEEAITPAALKTLYGVDVQVIEVEAAGRRLRVCAPALGASDRG
jgi:iron complex transport system ATP-binding protein